MSVLETTMGEKCQSKMTLTEVEAYGVAKVRKMLESLMGSEVEEVPERS